MLTARLQIHKRRLEVIAEHPRLCRHLWIIQALGPNGMSSDEEEHNGVRPIYRRVTQPWRNPILVEWFRVIDIFVRASHFGPDGASRPGAHLHAREVLPTSTSTRAYVSGLPRSAYDPSWLTTLSEFELDAVSLMEKPYSFRHEEEIYKRVYIVLFPAQLIADILWHREAAELVERFKIPTTRT